MLSIEVNEREIEKLFLEELHKTLRKIETRYTFWDMKELCRQTHMSENNIKEKFFHDPNFPKHKVGAKWLFPAAKCEQFLLDWISKQPSR